LNYQEGIKVFFVGVGVEGRGEPGPGYRRKREGTKRKRRRKWSLGGIPAIGRVTGSSRGISLRKMKGGAGAILKRPGKEREAKVGRPSGGGEQTPGIT
jgi:hypothetical protein